MPPKKRSRPIIKLVNPVAIALEQAKADIKRENSHKRKAVRKDILKYKRKVLRAQPSAEPEIQLITPWARALEQAKSDLKRGSEQMDIYDRALEQDAKRKKLAKERKARRQKAKNKMSSGKQKSNKQSKMSWRNK